MESGDPPPVSVVLPVLNEEAMLPACLESIRDQDYPNIVEVVVADGGSTDRTREVAASYPKVVLVDNPRRIRPAGLNVAIARTSGEVIVRVDARTRLSPDYVTRCVEALDRSGAAIVGGPMAYEAVTPAEKGIAAAMMSRLGAGPAEFRRLGGEPRFVDTVYLGAFRKAVAQELGGYDEWSGGNEDAEFAFRAQSVGGAYLDPAISSRYSAREGLGALARQFYRYGRNRARTVRKHPESLSWRQLAPPFLLLSLLSPWRRTSAGGYVLLVTARATLEAHSDPAAAGHLVLCLPVMHLAWGVGFFVGILTSPRQADSDR